MVDQLGDAEGIRKARVHPIALLAALRTYGVGRGARGRGVSNPVREVIDALDAAFYTAFENVEPTGKRLLLALDVSGSMTYGEVAGVPAPVAAARFGGAARWSPRQPSSGTRSSASSPATAASSPVAAGSPATRTA